MMRVLKDPDSDLDYVVDWSTWLGDDTIVASTWTVPANSQITKHNDGIDLEGKKTVVWLRGGVVKKTAYPVVNHIETAAGRKEDLTLLVTVAER